MGKSQVKGLRQLARLYGIQTEYRAVTGRLRAAAPEALLGVLEALGAPVGREADVAEALRLRRHALRTRRVEPVVVAWDGRPTAVTLRLDAPQAAARLACLLTTDDGRERAWTTTGDDLVTTERVESEGRILVAKRLMLPA